MFRGLADKLSLTGTEIRIFLFLIFVLAAGLAVRYYTNDQGRTDRHFDYSADDSLFLSASRSRDQFDYKQEVLDFNKTAFRRIETKKAAVEKSINLNTAGITELVTLPGIGEKTAAKIVDYRSKNGKFNDLDQLREVRGIGEKKLQKIRKYLFID